MKQTKLEIQKALAEDSTVYEYDSIYDEMQEKKEENNPKLLLGKDRKPKYIHNLLKAVELRKKEQEKRMEKKIQREREMEKGEFDDKEAFVTSAYKKKLQERAEEEEREKKAAALEARLDVTKQKDLSGFYRHLLNQAVGEEEVPKCSFREASFERTGIKEEKSRGYSDEDSHRHREASHRDSHWKRHEQKDASRGRDQRERDDREWKRGREREKYSSREQERDKQQNDHDRYIERGGEKEEKSKTKKEHMKIRKERYENNDKYRDREKQEVSVQPSERNRDRREGSPNSKAKDEFLDHERFSKIRNMEKDKERRKDKPSSSETPLGAKHRLTEERQEQDNEQERPPEAMSKFAKRNKEETVMSARDRYLARQMARVNAKTYIEKEDD
ncbi:Hypothetical predicted protein [Marmota monax]|uniref:Nuclear speckle splicing regulatory protein 1 n=1 Tax=Marmota monax TaxID=9995 RepID=A0A5E4CUN7_MARMO|nr:nuclear speckle splicing regulatory protein 1 [Marmota monax]VTJ85513.1 Hypothetical predicted protein [Marmota monax]